MQANWITIRRAADILDVSHNTLRAMIAAKKIAVLGYVEVSGDRPPIAVLDRAYILSELARKEKVA